METHTDAAGVCSGWTVRGGVGAKEARRVACRVPASPNGVAVLRDSGSKYILITFFFLMFVCKWIYFSEK